MKFEAGKEYKTRDGTQARVYSTNTCGSLNNSIHGAVFKHGAWHCHAWAESGYVVHGEENYSDLMPNPREFWVNVYGDVRDGVIHKSKTDALGCACDSYLETIKVREVLEDE